MLSSLLKFAPVQVFSSLSIFFLIAIQTRFLSVEEYGLLALLMVLIELFRACTSQWLSTSLLRLYPSASLQERRLQAVTALKIIYGLWLPACGGIALCLLAYNQFQADITVALACLLLAKSVYLYFVDLARLNERVGVYRKAVVTQSLMALILSFVFLNYQDSINNAVYALLSSYLLGLAWVYTNEKTVGFSRQTALKFIQYGGPLLFAGLLAILRTRIDRFFIADLLGLTETGIYAALSSMLLGVAGLVFMIVAMPLYPDLSRLTNQPAELELAHGKYLDMLMAVVLPSLIGLCFIAEPMTLIFLSKGYATKGSELFYIIAMSVFLLNLKGHYIDHGLQFLLKTKYLTFVSVIMLFVNIVLLLILIKPLGVYGAAWAGVLANFIALVLTATIAIKHGYRYSTGSDFGKVILSSFWMCCVLWVSSLLLPTDNDIKYLICLVLIGALSYGLAMVWLNGFGIQTQIVKRFTK